LIGVGKILVVRLSSIGDIILTTPLLRSVRNAFPAAEITYVVKKEFVELLSYSPYIDHLITFDKSKGFKELRMLKNRLQSQKFDIFLDIHKNLRSRYLRICLHAKQITSYSKQIFNRTLLIWFHINRYKHIKPVYMRYFESVKDFGIDYDGGGTEVFVPENKLQQIKKLLEDTGYKAENPLVVLCPSATYSNKRWKAGGFVETANSLIRKKGAFIVLLGGGKDMELCGEIETNIGNNVVSFSGRLSLIESAALLKHSKLVIANDSGLLHLAQSQKVPVIGIYGATTRELGYFPIEQNSIVIENNISCRPCTHNGLNRCPKKHFNCMNEIDAARVINAALTFLN
jgi:lipopolysaccharide heptosyltransferase II